MDLNINYKIINEIKLFLNIGAKFSSKDIKITFFIIFCSTILEAFSVGIIIPIFSKEREIIEFFINYGINIKSSTLIIIVIILFFIKNIFSLYCVDKINKFSFKTQSEISCFIFEFLDRKDYKEIINKGKDYYLSLLNTDVINFRDTLTLVLLLISEVFIVFTLGLISIYLFPLYSIIVIIVITSYLIIYKLIFSNKSKKMGEIRVKADKLRSSWLRSFLDSYEEVKIGRTNKYFYDNYKYFTQQSCKVGSNQLTINQAPRLILEIIVVLLIGFLAIYISTNVEVKFNNDFTFLSVLSLAAIGMRAIPSFSRISGALQGIHFGLKAAQNIQEQLRDKYNNIEDENCTNVKLDKIETIELKEIKYLQGGKKILYINEALHKKGELCALIGESGSGKSTYIKIILGLINPENGEININGSKSKLINSYVNDLKVSYIPQKIYLNPCTIIENIILGRKYEFEKIEKYKNLLDWVDEFPNGLETIIGEGGVQVSGGQAQKISILRGLYSNPDLLILDESTGSLDANSQVEVMKILVEYSRENIVILITHRTEVLEYCNKIINISNGKIVP